MAGGTGDLADAGLNEYQASNAERTKLSRKVGQLNNRYENIVSEINKINNTIDAFNKQAELIEKQNKEIQADLERRGYKFSKTGDVEGQTPAQMIKIIQADLEAKGYTFVDMDKKGMSTFDFDETLIIDGSNSSGTGS